MSKKFKPMKSCKLSKRERVPAKETKLKREVETTTLDEDELGGDEQFSIIGSNKDISRQAIMELQKKFIGFLRYGDCVRKAMYAQTILGVGELALGEMYASSICGGGGFGYAFNPPRELHAWLDLGNGEILDMALAGVIQNSMRLLPELIFHEPVILCGKPPYWAKYQAEELSDEYREVLQSDRLKIEEEINVVQSMTGQGLELAETFEGGMIFERDITEGFGNS